MTEFTTWRSLVDGAEILGTPDDLVYQIRREEFDDPWPANIGDAEMSVVGLSASNGTVEGGQGDHGLSNIANIIGQRESWGIATTIAVNWDSDIDHAIAVRDGSRFDILNSRENSGSLGIFIGDDDGNQLSIDGSTNVDDGDIRPVVINKFGNSADQMELFIGDMSDGDDESTVNLDNDFNHENFNVVEDLAFYARNDGGSIEREPENMKMGVFEIKENPFDESERESFVSRRDEVS